MEIQEQNQGAMSVLKPVGPLVAAEAEQFKARALEAAKEKLGRVLVDAIGSKAFLKSQLARDLRQSGVRVAAALPAGAIRLLFRRPDLRLHRKIAIFDGVVAYTGV